MERESKMIPATVGRIVWLYNAPLGGRLGYHPFAATIAYPYDDRLINVSYVDHRGETYSLGGVELVQEGMEAPTGRPYCTWMPYQIGQAKQHDRFKKPGDGD